MNKYQEALDIMKQDVSFQNEWNKACETLQKLIDLHTPKEIKVGQVWECVVGVGTIGEYVSEWVEIGEVIEITSVTAEKIAAVTNYEGFITVIFLTKDLLNSSCFKLVKDVER